jgi:hypothetical protein
MAEYGLIPDLDAFAVRAAPRERTRHQPHAILRRATFTRFD